jgi:hypothetical protein
VLATLARLATGWRVGSGSFCDAGLAGTPRPDRLVEGGRGLLLRRAVCSGSQTGPNPTDRAKQGSKRHLICDGRGVPLAIRPTGANRNDSQEALALWMPFLHYTAHAGDRGSGRTACSEITATTRRRFAAVSGLATRALAGHAPHRAWEWPRPVALGRGERTSRGSFSFAVCAFAATNGRHRQGLSLVGMRADLLAVPSKEVVARLGRRGLRPLLPAAPS